MFYKRRLLWRPTPLYQDSNSCSPFFIFIHDFRRRFYQRTSRIFPLKEIICRIGPIWSNLSIPFRRKYEKMAKSNKLKLKRARALALRKMTPKRRYRRKIEKVRRRRCKQCKK